MNKQFEPLFTPYDPRQDHRFYSFKMQQEAPILGASCCVKKENAALYWPR